MPRHGIGNTGSMRMSFLMQAQVGVNSIANIVSLLHYPHPLDEKAQILHLLQ